MAKIPTYPNKATLDGTELFHIVDPADTTDDPTGTSKHATAQAVADLVPAGIEEAPQDGSPYSRQDAGWVSVGNLALLADINLSVAGEFDFNNIPQGYDRIIIAGEVRGNDGAATDAVHMYLNADETNGNYHYQQNGSFDGNNPFAGEGQLPKIGDVPAGGAPAGSHSPLTIVIENYAGTNLKQGLVHYGFTYGAQTMSVGTFAWTSAITAAITRVRLRADGHPTQGLTGRMRVYGVKATSPNISEGRTLIQTITDPGGGEFDFQSIPAGYKRLILKGRLASTFVGDLTAAALQVNGNATSANYWRQYFEVNGAATNFTANASNIGLVAAGTTSTGAFAEVEVEIEGYDLTAVKNMRCKSSLLRTATAAVVSNRGIFTVSETAPITSLKLVNTDAANLTGELSLYGET